MNPTRVVLLADTHVPKRARELPEPLWRAIDAADVELHRLPPRASRP